MSTDIDEPTESDVMILQPETMNVKTLNRVVRALREKLHLKQLALQAVATPARELLADFDLGSYDEGWEPDGEILKRLREATYEATRAKLPEAPKPLIRLLMNPGAHLKEINPLSVFTIEADGFNHVKVTMVTGEKYEGSLLNAELFQQLQKVANRT